MPVVKRSSPAGRQQQRLREARLAARRQKLEREITQHRLRSNEQRTSLAPEQVRPMVARRLRHLLFGSVVRRFVSAAGASIGVVAAIYGLRPSVAIALGAPLSIGQPLQNEFLITNNGPWAFEDVHFSCVFSQPPNILGFTTSDMLHDQRTVSLLASGDDATRSCDAGNLPLSASDEVIFEVRARWFRGLLPFRTSRLFTTRLDPMTGQPFLVPDTR